MARPRKPRRICAYPKTMGFKPFGDYADVVDLALDEYEVMRLMDTLGYSQEECAKQMDVARSTIAAIYESARLKTADAIINGKSLVIHGGDVELCKSYTLCCHRCGQKACVNCEHGTNPQCKGNVTR